MLLAMWTTLPETTVRSSKTEADFNVKKASINIHSASNNDDDDDDDGDDDAFEDDDGDDDIAVAKQEWEGFHFLFAAQFYNVSPPQLHNPNFKDEAKEAKLYNQTGCKKKRRVTERTSGRAES